MGLVTVRVMLMLTAFVTVSSFEDEELGWSLSYLVICILMPLFNGFMNGYSWSGYSLHYIEMGWPLARCP